MKHFTSDMPYKNIRHLIAVPFILSMIFPLVILDIMMEIYHRIAFPLYGIPVVRRRKYIRIDRQKLSYLNYLDKIYCTYCGYANGMLAYCVKIAGETEKYWCGVKHKQSEGYVDPAHHKDFLEYGDEEAFNDFVGK